MIPESGIIGEMKHGGIFSSEMAASSVTFYPQALSPVPAIIPNFSPPCERHRYKEQG